MSSEVVLVQEFPDLARAYQVSSVPLTVVEPVGTEIPVGKPGASVLGARPEAAFLRAVLEAAGADEPGRAEAAETEDLE